MKKLLITLSVLVLIMGGALTAAYLYLGQIIKKGVETYGPQITRVSVGLGLAQISPLSGSAGFYNFRVGTPKGFTADETFKVSKIGAKVDTHSLFSKVIHINNIDIVNPEISYEITPNGTNIAALQRNIAQYTGSSKSSRSEKKSAAGPAKKVVIDRLAITGGKINGILSFQGQQVEQTIDLPDIILTGIGAKSGGATGKEVAALIVNEIEKRAGALNIADQLKSKVMGLVGDKINEVTDKVTEQVQKVQTQVNDAVQKTTDELGNQLNNTIKLPGGF